MTAKEKIEFAISRGIVVIDGQVWSNGIVRKPSIDRGYEYITVRNDKRVIRVKVHRLVAYQLYGDRIFESGIVVRHLDGNSLNNRDENIAVGTQQDNVSDIPAADLISSYKTRAKNRGTYDYDRIWELHLSGISYSKISMMLSIPITTIQYIITQKKKKINALKA